MPHALCYRVGNGAKDWENIPYPRSTHTSNRADQYLVLPCKNSHLCNFRILRRGIWVRVPSGLSVVVSMWAHNSLTAIRSTSTADQCLELSNNPVRECRQGSCRHYRTLLVP